MLPLLSAALRSTMAEAQALRDPLPPGTMAQPNRRSSTLSLASPRKAGADFVPVDQRIATFDNDGTLWVEQPMDMCNWPSDLGPRRGPGAGCIRNGRPGTGIRGKRRRRRSSKAVMASRGKGIGRTYRGDAPAGMDHGRVPRRSPLTGSRPRAITASSGPIPNWSISRCSNCSPTSAPAASRPSSR